MSKKDLSLSVCGLDIHVAGVEGIDAFDRFVYNGESCFAQRLAAHKRTPAFLIEKILTVLAEQVTDNALSDDVVLLSDRNVDELTASLFQHKNIRLTVVSSLSLGLQAVRELLATNAQQLIPLLALHLDDRITACDVELHTLAYGQGMGTYQAGEGAAGLLFGDVNYLKHLSLPTYAIIPNVEVAATASEALHTLSKSAELRASDIAYIESNASQSCKQFEQERDALLASFKNGGEPFCAIGSVRANIGDASVFSDLAALLKVVLVVYQRYIPAVPQWQCLADEAPWKKSCFYIPEQSRPWYVDEKQGSRKALLSSPSEENFSQILVEEDVDRTYRPNGYLAEMPIHCFPIGGEDEQALQAGLEALQSRVQEKNNIRAAAAATYEDYLTVKDASLALVVLGENQADVLKEITLMKNGLSSSIANNTELKTPKGSYFSPQPVGKEGGVAFVYPGVGAAYVGLGRDLFHMFPAAYEATDEMARDIGAMLKDRTVNPRNLHKLSFQENKELDLRLRQSLVTISECGVGFAYVFTKIFSQTFGVHADFALGYSMGEVSMYTALDCWQDPGRLSARLANSPTFNYGLTGEMKTLRKHWEISEKDSSEKLWETYTIKGTVEEVSAACAEEENVYITIINTPDSVLIGGQPSACERVIERLGVRGMAMEIPSAIHSEPAFKEYANMEQLYTLETAEKVNTLLYSSSCYLPVPQRTKSIANSIAKCFCEQVDFPRLVNTVYEKGARIFIEMGAGRSCCSWIDKILKHEGENKPHVSIPVNAKGTQDHLTLARCIAKLLSHRAEVDISAFYYGSMINTGQYDKQTYDRHEN